MRVRRFDSHRLRGFTRTPGGGIVVEAAVTRAGLFEYTQPDGSVRVEHRPESEVFEADSMRTLAHIPVTLDHPEAGEVNSSTWRALAVGNTSGSPRQDGDFLITDLVVQEEKSVRSVERKERREVSCGYTCQVDHTPGQTSDGQAYDAIQTDIQYNHVALVSRGRGGRGVALRLDAQGNQPMELQLVPTKIEIIDGTEYTVGSDAHRAAAVRRQDAQTESTKTTETLKAERDTARAELAEATKRLDGMEALVQSRIKERSKLIALAAKAGLEVKADASDADVRAALISAVLPEMDTADKSEDYLSAVLDIAVARVSTGNGLADIRVDVKGRRADTSEPDEAPDVTARKKMIARGAAWTPNRLPPAPLNKA